MKYEVVAVETSDLPEGVHTIIVERDQQPPLLLLGGQAAESWSAMQAWEDTIEPPWQPTVSLPAPRALRAVGF